MESSQKQEEEFKLPVFATEADRQAYYDKVMRECNETRARIDKQLKESEKVRVQVQDTLRASKEVDDKYEQFKQDFSNVMSKICENLSGQLERSVGRTTQKFDHKPVKATALQAASYLKDCKNILILTGAGLSAASGIPTFRGDGGFWTKSYEGHTDPTEILTMTTFKENPAIVWQWHWDFIDLMKKCHPNKGHQAIHQLQKFCQKSPDTKCLLVTQNIDNFHAELIQKDNKKTKPIKEGTEDFAFTQDLYEVHGNVLYMYCANTENCSKEFYLCPKSPLSEEERRTFVPKCKKCNGPMKPHCMFFDESYSERLYKSETVRNYLEDKMDGLIVIGTALKTALANLIVNRALNKQNVPVVEVNLESEIANGFGIIVEEKSEIALPILVNELVNLKTKKK